LHYLGPERLANQYSPASDLYSLGVIVLEMVAGKRPADLTASPLDPSFAAEVAKSLGHDLAVAIAQALHPDPAQRPRDAEKWATRCGELLRLLPCGA
jgi:serine/threonine-protein kinase